MGLKKGNNEAHKEAEKVQGEAVPVQVDAAPGDDGDMPGRGVGGPEAQSDPPAEPVMEGYVTVEGQLRDPFSKILYTNSIPMPAGHAGWMRVQLAAGVIKPYKRGS